MGSSLRTDKSGLIPLAMHLDFDIKGILALNIRHALSLAKHTVLRLTEMEAPDWAFKKLIRECFLALPELNTGWIIQSEARDFWRLIVLCGQHVDENTKDEIILVARRFRDYNLLRATVSTLCNRPLTQLEIREAADLLHVSSHQFSEVASLMCLDAYKMHGMEFRKEIKEMLVKKHGAWVDHEVEDMHVVPV